MRQIARGSCSEPVKARKVVQEASADPAQAREVAQEELDRPSMDGAAHRFYCAWPVFPACRIIFVSTRVHNRKSSENRSKMTTRGMPSRSARHAKSLRQAAERIEVAFAGQSEQLVEADRAAS